MKGKCRQPKSSFRRKWAALNQEQNMLIIDNKRQLQLVYLRQQQQLLTSLLLIATLRRSTRRRSHNTLKMSPYRWLYRPQCNQSMTDSSQRATQVTKTTIRLITTKTKTKMSEMEDEGHNSDVILNVAGISNNLNKLFISTLSTIRYYQNRNHQYIFLI